ATEYAWDLNTDEVLAFQVPVQVWDITLNKRITFFLVDQGSYDPGTGAYDSPNGVYGWEDGLYFEGVGYDSVSWTTPGALSDDYDPDGHGLSYRRMFIQSIAGDTLGYPAAGTVVRIITNKANTTSDVF